MPAIKAGPMTLAELQSIWESSVDRAYRDPFLAAGDGGGFEAWTQVFAQFERASKAVDVTTQAMFISTWSGQSNPPAGGARKSLVDLVFARTKLLEKPLVLARGAVFVEEHTTDAGTDGPVDVFTGRRYLLLDDVVFRPGEQGPVTVAAEAEKPGYGYDNPRPGTISEVAQPGSNFQNDHASLTTTARPAALNAAASRVRLATDNEPDMFVPDHVGQYVSFVTGSNAGRIARVTAFERPHPELVPAVGSTVDLELFYAFSLSPTAGTFVEGEAVNFGGGAAFGRVVGGYDPADRRLAVVLTNGSVPAVATTLVGMVSGATGTVEAVLADSNFVAEAPIAGVGGASWRVLDWKADWGLSCTNPEAPAGGRAAFLDELGRERGIGRAPGEDDESYRARVREIADVVTPNAVRRALNRALAGFPWCLREVGSSFLPGVYYDGDLSPAGGTSNANLASANNECSYDEDVILLTGIEDVGMSFDVGYSAYDSGLFPAFFDGSGSFVGLPGDHERVVLEEPDFDRHADGWFGRIDLGPNPWDRIFVFVRTGGRMPAAIPPEGLRVRGLHTGALFAVTSGTVPASAAARRFRRYFDYEQFRAFFLVGVPRFGFGEFGFAFDSGTNDAFDAQPYAAFFDGSPVGAADLYRRVYYAIDEARAGGVGFELYVEDVGCP